MGLKFKSFIQILAFFQLFITFSFLSCWVACRILVPSQGLNLSPTLRAWSPTTGPPGKSQIFTFLKLVVLHNLYNLYNSGNFKFYLFVFVCVQSSHCRAWALGCVPRGL